MNTWSSAKAIVKATWVLAVFVGLGIGTARMLSKIILGSEAESFIVAFSADLIGAIVGFGVYWALQRLRRSV